VCCGEQTVAGKTRSPAGTDVIIPSTNSFWRTVRCF
jgi:hypothetical protein